MRMLLLTLLQCCVRVVRSSVPGHRECLNNAQSLLPQVLSAANAVNLISSPVGLVDLVIDMHGRNVPHKNTSKLHTGCVATSPWTFVLQPFSKLTFHNYSQA